MNVGLTTMALLALRAKVTIGGALLVAGFAEQLSHAEFDSYNSTFLKGPYHWDHIQTKANVIKIYNSDNDPYVPLQLGKNLAHNLGVEVTVINGGGHLNATSGFLKFEQLLSDLKEILA